MRKFSHWRMSFCTITKTTSLHSQACNETWYASCQSRLGAFVGVIPSAVDPTLAVPRSDSIVGMKKVNENQHRSRWLNITSKMKLSTCELALLILLIISILLGLMTPLLIIRLRCKLSQRKASTLTGESFDVKMIAIAPTRIIVRVESERPFRHTISVHVILYALEIPDLPLNAKWTQDGVSIAGFNGRGDASNQLHAPRGLFVDGDQTLVIADNGNHPIVEWNTHDKNGTVVAGGNAQGNRLDQLNKETHVIIDKDTHSLIFCDLWNRRVMRWSRYSGAIQGEILLDNINCLGLATGDRRDLYISQIEKNEVRRYRMRDKHGVVVAGGHGPGVGLNQLQSPYFIFIDQQQSVYVSDNSNHRVMKWSRGAKDGTVVAGGRGAGSGLNQLHCPNGIFIDAKGTLYVADDENHRVMRWLQGAREGTVIVGGNSRGSGTNQFNDVAGLFLDRQGQLYVTDRGNDRIQRFSLQGFA